MQVTSQRASAILYNYLSGNHFDKPFLLPANVCPVVPLSFMKAGVGFEFIDIDESHAMSTEKCLTAIEAGKYSGLVFVHAYGKKYDNKEFYRAVKSLDQNLCIIDDCCLCIPELVDSLNKTPDILVFHSTTECYLYHKMKTNENSKVVLFFHSDGIPNKMLYSYYPCIKNSIIAKWLMRIHNEAFLSADKCVFIAKNGQDNFLKIYPDYPTKKTALILNGIEDFSVSEVEELKKVEQKYESFKYRLCSTGTINQRKGQRIIIEALAATKKDKREQIHLALIGEGPERVRLEKLVNDYGLAKNVTFEGLIENSQVYKYLYQNNIYILMSNNEGLPISIIEAMRTGLPVISTKISGIPELVDINGILIDPNVEQLTTIFDHMDEYDWNVMGKRSRERWKKDFTFDRMKKQYCDMLDSLF